MQMPGSMRTKAGRLIRFGVAGASVAAVCTGPYLLNDHYTFTAPRPGLFFLAANLVGILIGFANKYAVSVAWVWRRVV